MMITLIKALLKPYMQLYYIIDGRKFFIKIFTLILTRCCIIVYITTTELKLKNHIELEG